MAIDRRSEGQTVLRQTQLAELYLLEVLDEICQKHSIPYFLVDGTLLGALRHNGFIPWDDDIDVGMLAPDYLRFKKIVRASLPPGIYFQDEKDMHNTCPCGKLRDLKSFFFNGVGSAGRWDRKYYGVPIDVFPFVKAPNLPYKWTYLLLRFRMGPYGRWHRLLDRQRRSAVLRLLDTLQAMGWKTVHGVAIVAWHFMCLIRPSKIWHVMPESGFTSRCAIETLLPLKKHVFEGRDYPVPNDSETYLTTVFGNWRELPPVDKRPKHSAFVFPIIES